MRPPDPYDQPLSVIPIDGDIVFLGEGSASFSMTPAAARITLHNLAHALQTFPPPRAGSVVLVVEDEPLVREIAAALLEDAGHVAILTDNARAALATLEGGQDIHVLFTDVQMPGDLDGLALARLVRNRWPGVHLLVTSGQGARVADDVPDGGRFLAKPYAAADVLRSIDELTGA
jgi:CheY-like chemotaxis protein